MTNTNEIRVATESWVNSSIKKEFDPIDINDVYAAFEAGANWQSQQAQVPEGLRDSLFSGWRGCSNHDCIVTGPKRGMGTNGSCSCLHDASRAQLHMLKSRLQTLLTASPAPEHSGDGNEMVEILKWIASGETAKGCYDGSDEVGAIKERVTSFLARHQQQEEAER